MIFRVYILKGMWGRGRVACSMACSCGLVEMRSSGRNALEHISSRREGLCEDYFIIKILLHCEGSVASLLIDLERSIIVSSKLIQPTLLG
jgi:hypothetical protein